MEMTHTPSYKTEQSFRIRLIQSCLTAMCIGQIIGIDLIYIGKQTKKTENEQHVPHIKLRKTKMF